MDEMVGAKGEPPKAYIEVPWRETTNPDCQGASPYQEGHLNINSLQMVVGVSKTTTKTIKPILFNYTDFRKFLKDFYNYKRTKYKGDLRPYSYGTFSAAAGIKSPNYLKLIIEARRNLSPSMASQFAKALQFNKEETLDFIALVKYGQAKDPFERNQALKELTELRTHRQLKKGQINSKTWDQCSNWVIWVLYNMVDQENVEFNPQSLHRQLRGPASLAMVQKAYDTLFASGELVRDEKTGQVKKKGFLINRPENISVEMVRKLQSELIYLGLESLFRDEAISREFGAVTLALTKKEFEEIKFELRKLKKRFFKDVAIRRESSKGHQVYQLNIQFFPVTDPETCKPL